MNILSTWFNRLRGGSNAFDETVLASIDRANVRFLLPQDSRLYVTDWTRNALVEKYEWLRQTFPLVKELNEGIARHTTGKGISIQLETEDHDWNKAGERDFEAWALSPDRCDIAARRNFYEAQNSTIEQFGGRGESFIGYVQNPRWASPLGKTAAPAFWMIDSNDVGTPPNLSDFNALNRTVDGIQLGDYGEPQNYFVRTLGTNDYKPIGVSNLCHWFKPTSVNQPRGITPFAQAVNSLVDVHELRKLTTRSAKAQQLITMVLKDMGKTQKRGAVGALSAAPGDDKIRKELEAAGRNAGAGIAYVGANGDVKMVSSGQPSPLVEPFIRDLLIRDACLAPGVPMEFFWDPSKLSGANIRFVLGRADLFFQVLADAMIYRFCTPMAIRVLQWRMDNGLLPQCKDPAWMDRISWQLPARLTVDNGREGALDLQKLRVGMLNLRSYYNARGMNWRTELQQRIREMQELKKMCDEAEMPELFQYFIALDPGARLIQSADNPDPNKDPNDPRNQDTTEEDDTEEKKAA